MILSFSTVSRGQSINEYNVIKPFQAKEIYNVQDSWSTVAVISVLFPFNPVFMLEDKRFYAGITKEFSFGKFPFGRIAAEYSLIFRETHLNHLRFSYNYDIPLSRGDIAAVLLSVGGGYFTDFLSTGSFLSHHLTFSFPLMMILG